MFSGIGHDPALWYDGKDQEITESTVPFLILVTSIDLITMAPKKLCVRESGRILYWYISKQEKFSWARVREGILS